MSRVYVVAVVLFTFITYLNSQVVCPKCRDKYDPDSCDQTQECGVDWNWCELHVHTADYYSLEYSCHSFNECVNHEIYGCHPEVNEICFYCCEDIYTCKLQRDDIYTYVFPLPHPPQTTGRSTPAVTTPVQGPTFQCPACTDGYDHTSCTQTRPCSADRYDVCQLQVDVGYSNYVGYSCQKSQDCKQLESQGCDPSQNKVCTYCCLDPVTCQHQRDYLFDFVFFPQPATHAP